MKKNLEEPAKGLFSILVLDSDMYKQVHESDNVNIWCVFYLDLLYREKLFLWGG